MEYSVASKSPSGSIPISIQGAQKIYDSVAALNDLSLDIAAGEFVTLLGPSGSGKTTLLNILSGFIQPSKGKVFFGDKDVTYLSPQRRNVGLVFQNYALFPHLDVFENIAFPLRVRKLKKPEIERRVSWALELVKLENYARRKIGQLSGGQRQRVALARAIVFEPGIILMDEPLAALDKQLREDMQFEIRHLHDLLGATTIYVTHDQVEALTMSDRVAVLDNGDLIQVDSPRNLYENPNSPFVAEFIGESTIFDVQASGPNSVLFRSKNLRCSHSIPKIKNLLLVVRAEKLILEKTNKDGGENRIPAVINEIVYQGSSTRLVVEIFGELSLTLRLENKYQNYDYDLKIGDDIFVFLPPEDVLILPANG